VNKYIIHNSAALRCFGIWLAVSKEFPTHHVIRQILISICGQGLPGACDGKQ